MLTISQYKVIFVAVGIIGIVFITALFISPFVIFTRGEQNSELFLLNSRHTAEDFPFNFDLGKKYLMYIGVDNHMGSSAYYTLKLKLGNQTDSLPNSTSATPSPLQSFCEYKFFVADNKSWEVPLTFSISNTSFEQNRSIINGININTVDYVLNKESEWNTNSTGYHYVLLVELWIFNSQLDLIQFDNRFVYLNMNIT